MKFIYTLTIAFLIMSCSPKIRLTRLINKHPELVDTSKISTNGTIKVIDSASYNDLANYYDSLIAQILMKSFNYKVNDTTICNCDSVIKTVVINNKDFSKQKLKDKAKKLFEKPFTFKKDTLGISIDLCYKDGNIQYTITSKQYKIDTCKEYKYYDFKEFWLALALLVISLIIIIKK